MFCFKNRKNFYIEIRAEKENKMQRKLVEFTDCAPPPFRPHYWTIMLIQEVASGDLLRGCPGWARGAGCPSCAHSQ